MSHGGNKKKVGIVSALQHNPRLLILDEPTSGLDPLMQHEFFCILKELNANGTTVFLSSHILSEVQNNCNRAAIIRDGRLLACDSVENLCRTRSRKVNLKGDADLSGLEGIRNLSATDAGVSFIYDGPLPVLLSTLASGNVVDLNITEPSLEEIFMHYYE